ncbi:Polycystin-2 [Hondaea fermentalgiana]|uniref:Polycystin-2 n=1 Tax=Hondaea fermentalgiana TaxID=2315210 RepID=A0A2R5GEC7_9STRA|nr:Polycystin-2 [Hondaea fermentalgiana]|eukprot:GBG26174.1 Polycystin-2 [Hondaea fermentalgiana]
MGSGGAITLGRRSRYEAERFNPKYKGTPANQQCCVVYHQLLIDLRNLQYNEFLAKEMILHLLLNCFLMCYVGLQLELDQISDARLLQRQLLLAPTFPRVLTDEIIDFSQVRDHQDVVQYIFNVIFRNLLNPLDYPHEQGNFAKVHGGVTVVRGIRFRTIQVRPNSGCAWRGPAEFEPSEPCVAGFTLSRQMKENRECFRPSTLDLDDEVINSCDCYVYLTAEETGEQDFVTDFASYPGSGHVKDLSVNDETNFDQLQAMFAGTAAAVNMSGTSADDSNAALAFVNAETALLLISFTLISPNTNVVMASRMGFEFLPSGLVRAVPDFQEAPLVQSVDRGAGTIVVAVFLALTVVARLVFQLLNAVNLRRINDFAHGRKLFASAMELVLFVSLSLILAELGLRFFTASLHDDVFAALKTQEPGSAEFFVARASTYVARFHLLRAFSAFNVLVCCVYSIKYFRLFWGFRFLYAIIQTTAADLGALYMLCLTLAVSCGSFLLMLYGPYSLAYASFARALETCLLQVTGYFTTSNLRYASPVEELSISTFFIVFSIVCFNLIALNLYVSVVLKAFGIVFTEVVNQEQGRELQSVKADRAATGDGTFAEDDLPGSYPGEISRSSRLDAKEGIRVSHEVRAWIWRNRQLYRKYKEGTGSLLKLLGSCMCCVNHLHSDWLSTREIIERLQVWRKKASNQSANFLTFTELRRVLEGEARDYTQVDNFQVDYLFGVCSLRPSLARVHAFQRVMDDLRYRGKSTFDYARETQRATKQRELLESQRSDLVVEFNYAYKALMDVKLQQLRAEARLQMRIDQVRDSQIQIRRSLADLQATAQNLAARTEESITA